MRNSIVPIRLERDRIAMQRAGESGRYSTRHPIRLERHRIAMQ